MWAIKIATKLRYHIQEIFQSIFRAKEPPAVDPFFEQNKIVITQIQWNRME